MSPICKGAATRRRDAMRGVNTPAACPGLPACRVQGEGEGGPRDVLAQVGVRATPWLTLADTAPGTSEPTEARTVRLPGLVPTSWPGWPDWGSLKYRFCLSLCSLQGCWASGGSPGPARPRPALEALPISGL